METQQLTTMRLLWAFKFGAATNPMTGEPISRELDFYSSVSFLDYPIHRNSCTETKDLVVMPRPFNCAIEARSAEHRDVVAQALDDAELYLSRYEG